MIEATRASRRERLLEVGDVESERGVGAPCDRPVSHLEKALCVRQMALHVVQHVAEVGAGLCLGGLRPEQERDLLARLRSAAAQEQVREQRLGAGRLQRREGHRADVELKGPEKLDAQQVGVHEGLYNPAYRTVEVASVKKGPAAWFGRALLVFSAAAAWLRLRAGRVPPDAPPAQPPGLRFSVCALPASTASRLNRIGKY